MPNGRKSRLTRTSTQEALEKLALDRFAFLIADKDFRLEPSESARFWTKHRYVGMRVGIEVTLEFNFDYSVQIDLIRTQSYQLLPDWAILAVSQRWRYPVLWLLRAVPGASRDRLEEIMDLFKRLNPGEPSLYDLFLTAIAKELCNSVDYLASQPYEVLFPPAS